MSRTVTRLFDSRIHAEAAIRDLEAAGFDTGRLSLIASETRSEERRSFSGDRDGDNETLEGAGEGAATGGVIGAGVGLLAGLGALAVPGLGPVLVAGWLGTTLAGAATGAAVGGVTGGILGALKDAGVNDEDAHVYAEGVRRGGALVSVRVDDADAMRADEILARHGGSDASSRGQLYRSEGWTRFDESAGANI